LAGQSRNQSRSTTSQIVVFFARILVAAEQSEAALVNGKPKATVLPAIADAFGLPLNELAVQRQ